MLKKPRAREYFSIKYCFAGEEEKIPHVLDSYVKNQLDLSDVNRVLELSSIKQFFDKYDHVNGWSDDCYLKNKELSRNVEKEVKSFFLSISENKIVSIYDACEVMFRDEFWKYFYIYKVYEKISMEHFKEIAEGLHMSPNKLLKNKNLVEKFDVQITEMLKTPEFGAGFIVDFYLRKDNGKTKYYLPKGLTREDKYNTVKAYINGDIVNANILDLIMNGKSKNPKEFEVDVKLKHLAKKRYERYWDENTMPVIKYETGINVSFSPENPDCEVVFSAGVITAKYNSNSVNKKVIVEHRNNILAEHGSARCPVCGSDLFATMDEKLILKEADDYIQQNGKLVKVKESEKTNLLNEIESLYEKVISQAKSIVEKEKGALEVKVSALRKLNDELKPYVDAVRKLQITRREIFIENIDNRSIENLQKYIESQILPESAEMEMIGFYQKILTVLGYVFADETLKQTYEKVKNIISESYDITDFSYEQFVTKINAIDSVLANRSQEALRMKLKEERKKNETLDIEIRKLQILKNDAIQKAKSIRDIVESLSRDEYQKIGPTLSKFYNKLIRIGDNDGINIVHESDGISLIDDKGKNIVNILSNGQISVFLLAYFFAGINVRNEREKMKIFFIDDLTACMDDVNMLAFMDLLKYQISSKETMDQLFFVTCDNRISRLLKYKMNGHGIELKELLENDFKQ